MQRIIPTLLKDYKNGGVLVLEDDPKNLQSNAFYQMKYLEIVLIASCYYLEMRI